MKNVLFYAGLAGLLASSCKQSDVDVETARSIEGTYQAKSYDHFSSTGNAIAYPINGQELTLKIDYVSADTVRVQLTPSAASTTLPDGIYSPTQTIVYPKAYVGSPYKTASYIYLTGKPGDPVSTTSYQIWIYKDKQNADYFFAPLQTPTISRSIRFERQ